MQRLFARDGLGRAQYAIGSTHAIVQVLAAFFDEKRPRLTLVIDDDRNHFADLLDQVELAAAERDLVADLVKVAHRLRAFAIEPADGKAHLLQAAKDLFDLLRDDEG